MGGGGVVGQLMEENNYGSRGSSTANLFHVLLKSDNLYYIP